MTGPAEASAEELIALYARRALSPLEALQAVTERIARRNPGLNAFAVMNPRALDAARESTLRWQAGRPLGALDGVPVTVKDLIDVAGLPTRRGSRLTDPAPAKADAPIVTSLKAAGAVIIGKTTTTEFGWKSPGDCPLHGITRNPHDPAHTTGGSSSGAGAAAAAGFGPLHVGTDAGGSVRIPAAWCGVVGFKPSFGRIPQWPLGAFGHVAVAGPLARTVRDAALMLGPLAQFDARDPYALADAPRNWLDGIERGVAGLRVGILEHPGFAAPASEAAWNAVHAAARKLEGGGALVEPARIALPDITDVFTKLWGAALARVARGFPEERRDQLDAGLRQVAARFAAIDAATMMEVEALRLQAAHAMAMAPYDIVLCPTVPGAAPLAEAAVPDPVAALWTEWAPWTLLFNLTRQPAIAVPLGETEQGLPLSVQLAGRLYRDDIVLRAARVVEG